MRKQVEIISRDPSPEQISFNRLAWRGLSAELVSIRESTPYEFAWEGSSNYLALHDLELADGETMLDGMRVPERCDLRDRMTFAPRGASVAGWSSLKDGTGSFVALTFDPDTLAEEVGQPSRPDLGRPMVYFQNAGLLGTMAKLRSVLTDPVSVSQLYAETLGLLACLELGALLRSTNQVNDAERGKMSDRLRRRIATFVDDRIMDEISLTELAAQAGLSRFHFARTFKSSFGVPPHQYVLSRRIERAKHLLAYSTEPISEVALRSGFGGPQQFTAAFKKLTGVTPTQFRRGAG